MRKIGIMGGTFNPIHKGHLLIANDAYKQFHLDEVWVMPSKTPPHKENQEILTAEQRIEMVQCAIKENPHLILSLFEMQRDGNTYTYRTLKLLKEAHPDTEFYFIMGGDSLRDFHLWRKPEEIAKLCTILVACRDELVADSLRERIAEVTAQYGAKIEVLPTVPFHVSSSEIRTMLANGEDADSLLPPAVAEYIKEHKLYQNN